MKRLEFNETNKLADVLNAISKEDEKEIEVFVFPGSEILNTRANKEVIRLLAASLGKSVVLKGGEVAQGVKEAAGAKENLGFVEGKDVAEEGKTVTPEKPSTEKKKWFSLPKINLPKGPRWIYGVIGLVLLIMVGITATFWLVPSATVTLFTQAQFKDAELTLVASASATSPDADKGVVPLKTSNTTEEGSLEAKATGEKTVGTPAKGRVTIVNHDSSYPGHDGSKTFFAGTIITPTSGSAIQFTLDEVATVSASLPACTTNCEQRGVNVTAKAIGDQGNLPAGTTFKVGSADISIVAAKNDTNFTGGTSNKVTVVSAADQKKAKDELLKKLGEKAKKDLKEKNPGIIIPEGGLTSTVTDEVYSKKVDEEADSFQLNLKVTFVAKTFSEEDLKDLLIKSIEGSLPYGYQVDRVGSQISSEVLETSGEDLKIIGKIKASLVPTVSAGEIRKNITGKNFTATDRYLKSLEAISEFEIKINPSFFRIFGTMPFIGSRIKVEISQKE